MRLGALQPGYLPWLGFFDQIERSDVFVVYDDLPFERHSWRNRNRIRTPQGWCWLTVPVVNEGLSRTAIREIEISDGHDWRRHHWRTIRNAYARAPYFPVHEEFFAKLYETPWRYLVDIDVAVIDYLVGALGITTRILLASAEGLEREYVRATATRRDATERMIFLCRRLGAERFLEGALGRAFTEPERAERAGVTIEFHDYRHPTYRQRFEPFVPYLSTIDLLFNHGPAALEVLAGRTVLAPA